MKERKTPNPRPERDPRLSLRVYKHIGLAEASADLVAGKKPRARTPRGIKSVALSDYVRERQRELGVPDKVLRDIVAEELIGCYPNKPREKSKQEIYNLLRNSEI